MNPIARYVSSLGVWGFILTDALPFYIVVSYILIACQELFHSLET